MLDEDIKQSYNPKTLIKELDKHIIGQHQAKEALATLMFIRAIRMSSPELELPDLKSNLLLIGPTGTGKTSLIKTLSKISGLPITIFDVTGITTAGFVGGKVEEILERMVDDAIDFIETHDLELDGVSKDEQVMSLVENGIVYLDEVDKLSITNSQRTANGTSHTQSVQNELLKFFEGSLVNVSINKGGRKSDIVIDTSNISFICGGAFSGLEEVIYSRKNVAQSIGFNSDITLRQQRDKDPTSMFQYVTNDDLVNYGLTKELVGRLALRAVLKPLTKADFLKIMSSVDNNIIKQYRAMFGQLGKALVVDSGAREEIADFCLAAKTGARSLKYVLQKLLNDYLVNILDNPDKTIRVSKKDAIKVLGALK